MILVDIGNTALHFGVEKKGKVIKNFRVYNSEFNLKKLKTILSKYPKEELVVCSVAPTVTSIFKKIKSHKINIVGKDLKVPIKCLYRKDQIGQDRLVNAYAAYKLYPQSRIIIDFGTAITVDFLSSQGGYIGGFILPGIELYLRSLSNCQLLPKVNHLKRKTRTIIPKNTHDSISQGVVDGFSIMVNGFIEKYSKITFKNKKVKDGIIITGGQNILKNRLNFQYKYLPLLTLKGLILLKNT